MELPVVTDLSLIDAADRALVYCYADWSSPELISRKIVEAAIDRLRLCEPPVLFQYFSIDEYARPSMEWLKAHQHRTTAGGGALLWLEYGRTIAYESHAMSIGIESIVARTKTLWAE